MTSPTPPFIECERTQTCLAVGDLAAAIDFYVKKLGFRFGFTFGEPASFAGLNLGNVGIFLKEAKSGMSAKGQPKTG